MNKEQLFEDVKFPLKWDSRLYKMYIFDSANEMIAHVDVDMDATEVEHPFEKLIGDFKEVPKSDNPTYANYQGDFYHIEDGITPIGCTRGWGRLQYKDNPEQRQDNITEYILNVLNN